jgi:hypothetical protein
MPELTIKMAVIAHCVNIGKKLVFAEKDAREIESVIEQWCEKNPGVYSLISLEDLLNECFSVLRSEPLYDQVD